MRLVIAANFSAYSFKSWICFLAKWRSEFFCWNKAVTRTRRVNHSINLLLDETKSRKLRNMRRKRWFERRNSRHDHRRQSYKNSALIQARSVQQSVVFYARQIPLTDYVRAAAASSSFPAATDAVVAIVRFCRCRQVSRLNYSLTYLPSIRERMRSTRT